MGLFRRRPRPGEPTEPTGRQSNDSPQEPVPPVEYSGIASGGPGEQPVFTLYEFQTAGGVWVRLHDMQFLGFDYRVQPATLTMRFVYDDPEWTPPDARETPVAVFTFGAVQVWQWENDHDVVETPVEARGQVNHLEPHEPTNVFSLGTMNTTLLFSAARLDVHLEPLAGA